MIFKEGETKADILDPCNECSCDRGQLTCSRKACPVLSCKPEEAVNEPGQCCAKCSKQNDLSKGLEVGTLAISYDGHRAEIEYQMFDGSTMDETHLYVGTTDIDTVAPGQFGNTHDLDAAASDHFVIDGFRGEPIFVVAHAVVCSE